MSEYIARQKFPVPLDRKEVTQSWRQRGYSCEVFVDPPGREWNNFVHPTNELVTVVEGKLQMAIEDDVFVAGPGDEVYIPKGTCHSVNNIHHATTIWFYGYDEDI